MTKEQIPVKGFPELLGQLYSLAREYPNFTGYAACHESDADIRATVGQGREQMTFVFVNDDPRVMRELVHDMARNGCLAGDAINARAIIRRVDQRKASSRRSKTWMTFALQCSALTLLTVGTSLAVCTIYFSNLTHRVGVLEAEVQSLRENRKAAAPLAQPPSKPNPAAADEALVADDQQP